MSTAVAHRRAVYGHNRNAAWQTYLEGELPEGYRRVEYIEGSWPKWIDTGYAPDWTKTFEASVTASADTWDSSKRYFLLGNYRDSETEQNFNLEVKQDMFRIYLRTGNIDKTIGSVLDSNVYTFYSTCDANALHVTGELYEHSVLVASDSATKNIINETGTRTLYLFKDHRDGTGPFSNIRLHACYISQDGVKKRYYIPCVRTSDSKPGLYDLCGSICPLSGTPFYINAGSGADFTYGEL